MRDAFGRWVQMCGLNRWIQMEFWDANPDEHTWGRVPLLGMTDPMPHLDNSTHGREYEGFMCHGTCFSQLPNILSTGVVLRSAVPTRGSHAVWAAEEIKRALEYSPPAKLNHEVAIRCALMLDVRRAKSSHFQTSHKIFMLREAWHGIAFLCVCKDSQQGCFRSARPFGMLLPKFQWEQGFSNWAALPAEWRVNVIPSSAASASRQEIPDIPRPT